MSRLNVLVHRLRLPSHLNISLCVEFLNDVSIHFISEATNFELTKNGGSSVDEAARSNFIRLRRLSSGVVHDNGI